MGLDLCAGQNHVAKVRIEGAIAQVVAERVVGQQIDRAPSALGVKHLVAAVAVGKGGQDDGAGRAYLLLQGRKPHLMERVDVIGHPQAPERGVDNGNRACVNACGA